MTSYKRCDRLLNCEVDFSKRYNFISEQADAQEKTIRVLSEMSVRLQTIEHRMEVLHMQPPSVTKKEE